MHTFAMSSSKSSNLRSSGRSYIFLIFVAGYPLDSEYFRTNLGKAQGFGRSLQQDYHIVMLAYI